MALLHWRDDVYFERLPNGDVRVKKMLGEMEAFAIVVPAREWCAIVSGCSARPSDQAFVAVERIHAGR